MYVGLPVVKASEVILTESAVTKIKSAIFIKSQYGLNNFLGKPKSFFYIQ